MKFPKGWMKPKVDLRLDCWQNSLLVKEVPIAIEFLKDMGYDVGRQDQPMIIPDWLAYFAHRMIAMGWRKTKSGL
jgi:hypothetical protein